MQFAICDDEFIHRQMFEDMIKSFNPEIICELYAKGETLVEDIKMGENSYDAIFLDMEMNGMNGIETANAIREIDDRVLIIFVTSHEKYAVESFQCEPLDFLLKPVQLIKFETVIKKIQLKLSKKRTTFTFFQGSSYVRLYCDDIIYCESARNYTLIHTENVIYRVRMTTKEIESKLEPGRFARCHRSYYVNLEEVKTIDNTGDLHFYHSNDVIHIGDTYHRSFFQALLDYELT